MEPHFWLSQGKLIGICTSSLCELTWNLLGLMWSRMAEMARCILEPPWNISTVPHKSSSIYRRLWDACRQRQRAFQVLSHTLDWHLSISLVRGRSTKILQKFTWTLIYRRPHLWHRSRRWWESCRQINITLRHRLIWLSPIGWKSYKSSPDFTSFKRLHSPWERNKKDSRTLWRHTSVLWVFPMD